MPTHTVTKASPLPGSSPGNSKNTKSPGCKLYFKLREIDTFDYPDSPTVSNNGFGDPVYETLDSLEKNKKNDAAGWLILASLDKQTTDRGELCDKINQLRASQNLYVIRRTMNLVMKMPGSRCI